MPPAIALLVEPPGEVQALEQELDGRRDDRRLLGPVGHVERAEPIDRRRSRPGTSRIQRHVLARRGALAGLDDEPVLERLDDRVQVVERRRAG